MKRNQQKRLRLRGQRTRRVDVLETRLEGFKVGGATLDIADRSRKRRSENRSLNLAIRFVDQLFSRYKESTRALGLDRPRLESLFCPSLGI